MIQSVKRFDKYWLCFLLILGSLQVSAQSFDLCENIYIGDVLIYENSRQMTKLRDPSTTLLRAIFSEIGKPVAERDPNIEAIIERDKNDIDLALDNVDTYQGTYVTPIDCVLIGRIVLSRRNEYFLEIQIVNVGTREAINTFQKRIKDHQYFDSEMFLAEFKAEYLDHLGEMIRFYGYTNDSRLEPANFNISPNPFDPALKIKNQLTYNGKSKRYEFKMPRYILRQNKGELIIDVANGISSGNIMVSPDTTIREVRLPTITLTKDKGKVFKIEFKNIDPN